ncbi:hypothetical protein [Candidatus Palauibacter sp.]|uniref:hypothetical protein n=1 Tax=Candidatus Palauibacter sp. TaxID=3101350 RepID=UPI003B018F9F
MRNTLLAGFASLALALSVGCGMADPVTPSDPGRHVSGTMVDEAGNFAARKGGDKSDRAALTALYEATGGKNWTRQDNWLTDAPLHQWEGVRVGYVGHTAGRVLSLELGTNNLTGKIPAEIGDLTYLVALHLGKNNLTGKIPREVGNLKKLDMLWLSENDLTGRIPAELGNLIRLRQMYLDHNRLTGSIPSQLGDLSELKEMRLDHNRLTGKIPPQLGNIRYLQVLNLSSNRLRGAIPATLDKLVTLKKLRLGDNRLKGKIPTGLFLNRYNCIWELDLGKNRLQGRIPSEIGRHGCLRDLRLDRNKLAGPLPETFLHLRRLDDFHFGGGGSACAPNTDDFVAWLDRIENSSGPFCDDSG